jgi:hypothetical protein
LCVTVPETDEYETHKASERKSCHAKQNTTNHWFLPAIAHSPAFDLTLAWIREARGCVFSA